MIVFFSGSFFWIALLVIVVLVGTAVNVLIEALPILCGIFTVKNLAIDYFAAVRKQKRKFLPMLFVSALGVLRTQAFFHMLSAELASAQSSGFRLLVILFFGGIAFLIGEIGMFWHFDSKQKTSTGFFLFSEGTSLFFMFIAFAFCCFDRWFA